MAETQVQRSSRIEDSLCRLVELTSNEQMAAGSESPSAEFATQMEDCLYELTGQLLELFRLEDQHYGSRGPDFDRLLIARRGLSEDLHQMLESVVSTRTCGNKTPADFRQDVELMSKHFLLYRQQSLSLNLPSAPR